MVHLISIVTVLVTLHSLGGCYTNVYLVVCAYLISGLTFPLIVDVSNIYHFTTLRILLFWLSMFESIHLLSYPLGLMVTLSSLYGCYINISLLVSELSLDGYNANISLLVSPSSISALTFSLIRDFPKYLSFQLI